MKTGSQVIIRPARNVRGSVQLPGDKSVSHRYAMLAGIAEGPSRLENYSTGADCASTLGCMRALGVTWERKENVVEVQGRDLALAVPNIPLDCGNSGSTMRMLSGIVAAQKFTSEMTGDESLSRRPMERVIRPLSAMGAQIASREGKPPLRITGAHLKAIDYKMPVASAQVKSCLLFAGLFAEGETRVEEPLRTRDHGEVALQAFGAQLERKGNEVRIRGGQRLRGIGARIPGDLSSAAFFLCAAALFPDSQLTIPNLLMNPNRARLLDILMQMGLRISVTQLDEIHGELVGSLQIDGARLKGATLAGADSAALIDEIPVLAAIAPYTEQGIEVRDARELRVKESDRIAAVATNLRLMGAQVEERDDGLRIPGGQTLRGAELDSFGDHRIAMAFAVAALRAQGETLIRGSEAAAISYPAFFSTLEDMTER
ncbi:3-phosphoshikimate 1-carboxyvinyltransferase [Candidatus Sulfotelmatobacter kueseliae]|uniref:3-phosphoshikimate 1-carboxyvinyltransferase n=1 Tax=Candidatus Sulfotelmatobacter kueseliae TaxID=2042962 RepID=A0A2U3KE65_9BACT|nr:3-phosphoshikimate 1-carboxyvinyltransferase [Candidatus Sulfotelmatobacter kueseliae]